MLKKIKNNLNNNWRQYLIILFVYVFSQCLLLLVSGRWYDDWCSVNISSKGLWQWVWEMGRPDVYITLGLFEILPHGVYRIVTFISFLAVAYMFYYLLEKVMHTNKCEALMICILSVCLPLNDARVQLVIVPYTLGILFFFMGFVFLVNYYEENKIFQRVLALLFFTLSFTFNSMLSFYSIVCAYLVIKNKKFKNIISKVDFFALPIAFYLIKSIFFKSSGVYGSYNKITLIGLFNGIIKSFMASFNIYKSINNVMKGLARKYVILAVVISAVVTIVIKLLSGTKQEKKTDTTKMISVKKDVLDLIIGFCIIYVGLYPYIVVRGVNYVFIGGFEGRDSALAVFGASIVLFKIIKLIFRKNAVVFLVCLTSLCGIICFNFKYIDYQKNYYQSKGLQFAIENSECVDKGKAFAIMGTCVESYYGYNGIAEEVYSEEKRCFVGYNPSEMNHFLSGEYGPLIDREWYNMSKFPKDYDKIDAILDFHLNLSTRDTIYLRYNEIFHPDKFKELLVEKSQYNEYPEGSEKYEELMEQYSL